jgi:hypothetical protein
MRLFFTFFKVKSIMTVLSSPFSANQKDQEDDLYLKSAMLGLMKICYMRLPMAECHSKTGSVLTAYLGPGIAGNDKDLTTALIKMASESKKKMPAVVGEPAYIAKILYNEAAYCVIATCLSSTQHASKTDIFAGFLFAEKPILWENIIDLQEHIFISKDIEEDMIYTELRRIGDVAYQPNSLFKKVNNFTFQFSDESISVIRHVGQPHI